MLIAAFRVSDYILTLVERHEVALYSGRIDMGVVKGAVQLHCVLGTRKKRPALQTAKSLDITVLATVAKFYVDEHFACTHNRL